MAEEVMEITTRTSNPQGSVKFPCPKCGKTEVVRTTRERQIVIKYNCVDCGFTGPN